MNKGRQTSFDQYGKLDEQHLCRIYRCIRTNLHEPLLTRPGTYHRKSLACQSRIDPAFPHLREAETARNQETHGLPRE